jgi:phosphoribosyl-ATP pyrophosphohydrolase
MAKDSKTKPKTKAAPVAKLKTKTKAKPAPVAKLKTKTKAKPAALARADRRVLRPLEVRTDGAGPDVLDRLWQTVESRRVAGDVAGSHSARLMARGTAKVAQKLGEEAVECVIEATLGHHEATVAESADLLYHLVVLWVNAGIQPAEVWGELMRREGISGIAEKAARPKGILRVARTTKLP